MKNGEKYKKTMKNGEKHEKAMKKWWNIWKSDEKMAKYMKKLTIKWWENSEKYEKAMKK